MSHRSRSLRHVGLVLAVAALAASLLAGVVHRAAGPAAASPATMARARAAAVAAQAPSPTPGCVQATNLAHVLANRATQWLVFVWAKGSNAYLGLMFDTTALREGPPGTWTKIESCGSQPPPQSGWPTVGYDLASTRAPLNENAITRDNVDELGRAWELTGVEGVSGTPIVTDGKVYVGDWANNVHALDAATGARLWSHGVGDEVPGAVAVDDERVYAGTWDGRVVALNRDTGAEVWEVEADAHEVAVIYGSPVVVDDLVIVPVSSDEWWDGGELTFRGSVVALDAATGEERWRYWTSCGPENASRDNCPADGPDEGPGVGVWAYPVVDTERNLVYIGTGNQYSRPTTGRSDALIALDLETGEQRWVHQFTEGDWWNIPGNSDPDVGPDADAMVPSLLEVNGVDAIGVGDKAGDYHVLNRQTGELIWTRDLTSGSIQGGVMASAAVVDGARVGRQADVIYLTSNRGGVAADLIALDSATGQELARVDVGAGVVSQIAWANGLVYVTDNSGRVAAYDAADGLRRVWDWRTPAPAAGGVAIANGLVYAGWGWSLNGESPSGGLLAFRIGGEPEPEEPGEEADGEALFAHNCAACHGADGSGGNGPSLRGIGQEHSVEEIAEVITNGRGGMPAWRDQLTADEIAAVAAYVASLPGDHDHDHGGHDHGGGGSTTTQGPTTSTTQGSTTTTTRGATTTTHGDHEH
ncbi:MAG TPA: PQQ-binding-like beta-propeller repeat protein [Acidimicrobiales bacterium]